MSLVTQAQPKAENTTDRRTGDQVKKLKALLSGLSL